MTAQISNSIIYQGSEYAIAGINGDGLRFDPEAHGIQLDRNTTLTCCYAGHHEIYAVRNGNLLIKDVATVGRPLGQLNGTDVAEIAKDWFDYWYDNVDIPVPFSGGLLIAKDFKDELYEHMGFHPAWKYETVIELIFKDGTLIESRDVSNQLEELRKQFVNRSMQPTRDDFESTLQWIQNTFSLQYGWGTVLNGIIGYEWDWMPPEEDTEDLDNDNWTEEHCDLAAKWVSAQLENDNSILADSKTREFLIAVLPLSRDVLKIFLTEDAYNALLSLIRSGHINE